MITFTLFFMLTTMTIRALVKKIGIPPETPFTRPLGKNLTCPIPDLPFIIDESSSGEDCIIDGRKRFMHIFSLASHNLVAWDLEVSVNILNVDRDVNSPIPTDLSELETGILNVKYIRNFLLLHQDTHSEKVLKPQTLADLSRRIYRHLMNNTNSAHSNPISLVTLVAELNSCLNQADIARILRRSEAWVSDTVAVSKLPLNIFASLEHGEISYSAAVVIARAESDKDREILFRLAKKLGVRSLRDVLRFLITKPNFATNKDALEKLLGMFSQKVHDVGGRARLQIQTGVERSLRRFFRSRLGQNPNKEKGKPGKDPQSLVFRLKITIDGKNAEDFTSLRPEKVDKMRKTILGVLNSAMI